MNYSLCHKISPEKLDQFRAGFAMRSGDVCPVSTSRECRLSAVVGLVNRFRIEGDSVCGDVELFASASNLQKQIVGAFFDGSGEAEIEFYLSETLGIRTVCIKPR